LIEVVVPGMATHEATVLNRYHLVELAQLAQNRPPTISKSMP
jgi:hypothetical protein